MPCPTCGRHSIICGACGNCLTHCTCPPPPGSSKSVVFICSRRRMRPQPCKFCGARSTRRCDFPVKRKSGTISGTPRMVNGTCDVYLCDRCAVPQATGIDYCPPHERNKVKIMEERLRSKL